MTEETRRPPPPTSLFRSEDWLAVWLGAIVIGIVLAGVRVEPPTFKWATDADVQAAAAAQRAAVSGLATGSLAGPATTLARALDARDRRAIAEAAKSLEAAAASVAAPEAKKQASSVAKALAGPAGATLAKVVAADNLRRALVVAFLVGALTTIGAALMGVSVATFVPGLCVVYAIATLAMFVAGNAAVAHWGLEYVIWALLCGLLISNVLGVPAWLLPAVRTEYFIKTGLVILGAGILFGEILQAGMFGLVQAIAVVLVVWYACYYLSQRLRVDDEFAVMLSTAVSICGVSAAIAACGAIQGDRRKLSYVTSLVLVCAVPMMILQPWAAKLWGLPDLVAGAWLGGTLDTSGSVVAAGALVSESAMKAGVIVKFSQNVLIGVAAFLLALWWTMRKREPGATPPSTRVIWERFPKFVLGFMLLSFGFSFVLAPERVAATKDTLVSLRTVWFAMAFACIGLETRFVDLVRMEGGRPALAFLAAQGINVAWTLILAYCLFGGIFVPPPDIRP